MVHISDAPHEQPYSVVRYDIAKAATDLRTLLPVVRGAAAEMHCVSMVGGSIALAQPG